MRLNNDNNDNLFWSKKPFLIALNKLFMIIIFDFIIIENHQFLVEIKAIWAI